MESDVSKNAYAAIYGETSGCCGYKLCPLKMMSDGQFGRCDREKCSWWSTVYRKCSIAVERK